MNLGSDSETKPLPSPISLSSLYSNPFLRFYIHTLNIIIIHTLQRTFYVKMKGRSYSSIQHISAEVPQGSVLGPVLYTVYIVYILTNYSIVLYIYIYAYTVPLEKELDSEISSFR